jgi:3-methylcrotonyl-CoA carboxylase alpha subunit
MSRALSDCEVAGTVTNLAFLGGLVAHPEFVAGDVDTGLIARSQTLLTTLAVAPPEPWLWAQAALAAAGLTGVPNWDDGLTLWAPLQHRIDLQHRSEMRQVLLRSQAPDQHHLEVDGHVVVARWQNAQWSFDGHAAVTSSQTTTEVTLFSSYGLAFDLIDPLARMSDEEAIGPVVTAPMPGQVRSVMVSLGQSVSQGDSLMILEAMKMEHSLKASRDGVVAEVLIEPGQQVAAGDALIRLDEEAG